MFELNHIPGIPGPWNKSAPVGARRFLGLEALDSAYRDLSSHLANQIDMGQIIQDGAPQV